MKKLITLLLASIMILSICACGNSESSKKSASTNKSDVTESDNAAGKGNGTEKTDAVKAAEDAIEAIGEVTYNSGDAIDHAEKLYNILTDGEKERVSNRLELVEARETYDALKKKGPETGRAADVEAAETKPMPKEDE